MLGDAWGTTAAERAARLPCDDLLPGALRVDRAVGVDAPGAVLFRRLCHLRVAPYSYDLLDNLGRRSPRALTPGLEELAPGQRFMRLFGLHSYADGEHITLRAPRVAVTYAVRPAGAGSRLHARVLFDGPRLIARPLALGDLVMMRKQLLTLRDRAEEDHRRSRRASRSSTPRASGRRSRSSTAP